VPRSGSSEFFCEQCASRVLTCSRREDLNHTGSHKINNAVGQVSTGGPKHEP
jgi:tryptophan synthase beta subunit